MNLMNKIRFGTYRVAADKLQNALLMAYKHGIRHFDTAQLYKNELCTYETLKHFDDVHITTKIRTIGDHEATTKCIELSEGIIPVSHLHTVLLHRPMPIGSWVTVGGYESKYHLGVSNYNIENLEYLKHHTQRLPLVNQIEFHPFCPDALRILAWCQNHNVRVQGHSILSSGLMFHHPLLVQMASTYNVSSAEIMIRWSHQHGVELVMSTTEEWQMLEWFHAISGEFVLDDSDMELLNNCSSTHPLRMYDNSWAPWMWTERVNADESFLTETIQQLQCDINSMNHEEEQPISDVALNFPMVGKNKDCDLGKKIALLMFPPKPRKKSSGLNVEQSYIDYNKMLKAVKQLVYHQRRSKLPLI
jgi:diketogulonate reductase-like aldo/keto reductase